MEYSRQHVVNLLRRAGMSELADEAQRALPDPIDADKLMEWGMHHGLSHDDLVSHFGGSP